MLQSLWDASRPGGPGGKEREAMGREPTGDAGSQGEGGTLGTHGQNLFWDGPATREGRRAKEREADQIACCNLPGTPPGWESREARRGRRSECLGSSLLAPFDAANNIPWLTYRQYRAAFFFTLVNSSCCLHNPTLLVGILLKKEGSQFFPAASLGCTQSFSVLLILPGITAHSA